MKHLKRLALPLAAALLLAVCGCAGTAPAAPAELPPAPVAAPDPAPETPPAPAPAEPDPAPETPDPIAARIAAMTPAEKVGQLFLVRPEALLPGGPEANGPVTAFSEEMAETLARYPVGGVVLFAKNMTGPAQLRALTRDLQAAASLPLFLAVDEEGGAVSRLANHAGFDVPRYPGAAAVGAEGADAVRAMGRAIGGYLAVYGFNMDFAPVADLALDRRSPIGDRAFSPDGHTAAVLAGAMAEGLMSRGVIPVYKHFPGHGGASGDSHSALAVNGAAPETLAETEWLPYTENDLTGCAVMAGHIALPAVTDPPVSAALDAAVVTGLLRERLGFDGLVITDAMEMAGAGDLPPGEAAVAALLAGCDVVLMPTDLPAAFDAVLAAVESGVISGARLDASVCRILSLKPDS